MYSAFSNEVPKLTIQERLKIQQAASLAALEDLLNKRNDIIGIEIMIADAGENTESQWGHALLHLVDTDNDFFNDIVLGFVAEVDDEQLSTRKGITGGYKVIPELKTIGEYWKQYVALEERALSRYIIPTSINTRQEIIKKIEEYFSNRDRLGNYYFLNNNCATVMFNFLTKVDELKRYALSISANRATNHGRRIDTISLISSPTIPNSLPKYFALNGLTHLPVTRIEHAGSMHKKLIKLLGARSYKDLLVGHWPSENKKTIDLIEGNFTNQEILRMLIEMVNMPVEVKKNLVKKHSFRNSNLTYEEVIGVTQLPKNLYQTFSTKSDLSELQTNILKFWSKEELLDSKDDVKTSLGKLKNAKEYARYKKIKLTISQEYINHYQLMYNLLEAL
jgi:hypothetical protein